MRLPPRYVVCAGRVITCDARNAPDADSLGVIVDGAVAVNSDLIQDVGPRDEVLAQRRDWPVVVDAPHAVITPGLVDAHTHLAWAGSRHDEFVLRMQGAGYEAIAAAGGGIVSSMRAVRRATQDELSELMARRLRRMAALGTTTCEIKSGYGLDLANELKQLRAIRELPARGLPRVVPTFLAMHAIAPEDRDDRPSWVHAVEHDWLPQVAGEKLAAYVDAYIDRNAFSVQEAAPLFAHARALGLGVRAHVGQFADVGGAELAAEEGAASVDHCEHVSDAALAKLARSGTRVVLLPVASLTLKQAPPRVDAMRRAGVSMVVASDSNPGTAPTESLPLAMALALQSYGLTPAECILGATREAAESLGLGSTCGRLGAGFIADLVVWDLPHEFALLQPWGSVMASLVIGKGRVLHAPAQAE